MKIGQLVKRSLSDNWYRDQYDKYVANRDVQQERKQIYRTIMTRPEAERQGKWSASDTGACGRKRQFTYLGFPKRQPDERAMNIFANGDYVHIRHQAFGLAGGYIERVEVPFFLEELNFRGTADAIASNGDGLEFKSINDRGWRELEFGPKDDHVWQVHAYGLALNIQRWRIIYENKNTQELKEFVVEINPDKTEQIIDSLKLLELTTEEKTLMPMLRECLQHDGFNWRFCPYNRICEDATWPTDSSESPSKAKLVIQPTSSSGRS